jgi:hypothetical protein
MEQFGDDEHCCERWIAFIDGRTFRDSKSARVTQYPRRERLVNKIESAECEVCQRNLCRGTRGSHSDRNSGRISEHVPGPGSETWLRLRADAVNGPARRSGRIRSNRDQHAVSQAGAGSRCAYDLWLGDVAVATIERVESCSRAIGIAEHHLVNAFCHEKISDSIDTIEQSIENAA